MDCSERDDAGRVDLVRWMERWRSDFIQTDGLEYEAEGNAGDLLQHCHCLDHFLNLKSGAWMHCK